MLCTCSLARAMLNPNIEIRVCFALVKKGFELLDKASIVITDPHS